MAATYDSAVGAGNCLVGVGAIGIDWKFLAESKGIFISSSRDISIDCSAAQREKSRLIDPAGKNGLATVEPSCLGRHRVTFFAEITVWFTIRPCPQRPGCCLCTSKGQQQNSSVWGAGKAMGPAAESSEAQHCSKQVPFAAQINRPIGNSRSLAVFPWDSISQEFPHPEGCEVGIDGRRFLLIRLPSTPYQSVLPHSQALPPRLPLPVISPFTATLKSVRVIAHEASRTTKHADGMVPLTR
jgi:hypothetical protein